jgi:hypothetical protein
METKNKFLDTYSSKLNGKTSVEYSSKVRLKCHQHMTRAQTNRHKR